MTRRPRMLCNKFLLEKTIFKVYQYIYTISLLSPLGKGYDPSFLITQECFVPSLVEIGPVILEKKIFKVRQYIFAILLLSPLGKVRGSSFKQTWNPFIKECFVPTLIEIGPVILENKIFKVRLVFWQFRSYLPLEKGGVLHSNKN